MRVALYTPARLLHLSAHTTPPHTARRRTQHTALRRAIFLPAICHRHHLVVGVKDHASTSRRGPPPPPPPPPPPVTPHTLTGQQVPYRADSHHQLPERKMLPAAAQRVRPATMWAQRARRRPGPATVGAHEATQLQHISGHLPSVRPPRAVLTAGSRRLHASRPVVGRAGGPAANPDPNLNPLLLVY